MLFLEMIPQHSSLSNNYQTGYFRGKVKGQLPVIYSFFLTDKLSNVILGSSGLNELDKADEKFRNRRRELMEKAKSLEEAAAAAKAKAAASSAASNTASIASTTLASVSERDKTKNNEDETAI